MSLKNFCVAGLSSVLIALCGSLPGKAQSTYYPFETAAKKNNTVATPPTREINTNTNEKLVLEYSMPGYSLGDIEANGEVFQIIRMQHYGLTMDIGAPTLPYRSERIVVPPHTEAVLRVIDTEFIERDGVNLLPCQPFAGDGNYDDFPFTINPDIYGNNQYYASDVAYIKDIQTIRGVDIASLVIQPVQFNPVTQSTRIYSKIELQISFREMTTKSLSPRSTAAKRDLNNPILKNTTLNANVLEAPGEKAVDYSSPEKTGYIILTTPSYASAADSLAQWKRQLGFHVEIVSQSYWTTTQVKNAIKTRYDSWEVPPSYFLILGDQEDIPDEVKTWDDETWYMSVYYACMDGAGDKMPDLGHGRIPVDNLNEAMVVVNKIIQYEKSPPSTPSFYQHAMHCAYFEGVAENPGITSKRYTHSAEESREYMVGQGYDIDRVYFTEEYYNPQRYSDYFSGGGNIPDVLLRSNGFAWDGDKEDIINGINEGSFYVFHRDHGVIDGWVAPEINNVDVARMENGDKLPVVFSINCHSGRFQTDKCFSEVLLQKENGGAVGVFGATEESYSGWNDAMIEGFLDAIWPNPGLLPVFGSGSGIPSPSVTAHEAVYAMGDVLNQGLFRMTETWDGWATERQYERFHYFGDPTMKIWTQQPTQITAEHAPVIAVGATSFRIEASNCSDAIATLCYNGDLQAKIALSDGTGTFTLPAPISELTEPITLTLSKHNYIPYISLLEISSAPISNFTLSQTTICNGDTIQLTDQSINAPASWNWSIEPSNAQFIQGTDENSQHSAIRISTPGIYTIQLITENENGTDTLTMEHVLEVVRLAEAPYVQDLQICDSGSVLLYVEQSEYLNRWWDSPHEGTLLHEKDTSYTTPVITSSSTYYVEALAYSSDSLLACTSERVAATVRVYPSPEVPVVPPVEVCSNASSFQIDAEGQNLRWYQDSILTEFLQTGNRFTQPVAETGIQYYYVTQSQNNCTSEATQTSVTVLPEVTTPNVSNLELCQGETAICIAQGDSVFWYNASKVLLSQSDSLIQNNLATGEHSYWVSNMGDRCESEPVLCQVVVHPLPVVQIGNDTTLSLNDSLNIACEADGQFKWSTGTFDNTILIIAEQIGLGTHEFSLEVSDQNHCKNTDSVSVTVIPVNSLEGIESTFMLYPNPTEGKLYLMADMLLQDATLQLFDMQGKMLQEQKIKFSAIHPSVIDLAAYPNGQYILHIVTDTQRQTIQVIKE